MSVPRDDFEAALAARRGLGPQYEDAVVESFVDKVEASIERRRRDDLSATQRAGQQAMEEARFRPAAWQSMVLGIISLVVGLGATPITLIAGDNLLR